MYPQFNYYSIFNASNPQIALQPNTHIVFIIFKIQIEIHFTNIRAAILSKTILDVNFASFNENVPEQIKSAAWLGYGGEMIAVFWCQY